MRNKLRFTRMIGIVALIISSVMFEVCFFSEMYTDATIFFITGVINMFSILRTTELIQKLDKNSDD